MAGRLPPPPPPVPPLAQARARASCLASALHHRLQTAFRGGGVKLAAQLPGHRLECHAGRFSREGRNGIADTEVGLAIERDEVEHADVGGCSSHGWQVFRRKRRRPATDGPAEWCVMVAAVCMAYARSLHLMVADCLSLAPCLTSTKHRGAGRANTGSVAAGDTLAERGSEIVRSLLVQLQLLFLLEDQATVLEEGHVSMEEGLGVEHVEENTVQLPAHLVADAIILCDIAAGGGLPGGSSWTMGSATIAGAGCLPNRLLPALLQRLASLLTRQALEAACPRQDGGCANGESGELEGIAGNSGSRLLKALLRISKGHGLQAEPRKTEAVRQAYQAMLAICRQCSCSRSLLLHCTEELMKRNDIGLDVARNLHPCQLYNELKARLLDTNDACTAALLLETMGVLVRGHPRKQQEVVALLLAFAFDTFPSQLPPQSRKNVAQKQGLLLLKTRHMDTRGSPLLFKQKLTLTSLEYQQQALSKAVELLTGQQCLAGAAVLILALQATLICDQQLTLWPSLAGAGWQAFFEALVVSFWGIMTTYNGRTAPSVVLDSTKAETELCFNHAEAKSNPERLPQEALLVFCGLLDLHQKAKALQESRTVLDFCCLAAPMLLGHIARLLHAYLTSRLLHKKSPWRAQDVAITRQALLAKFAAEFAGYRDCASLLEAVLKKETAAVHMKCDESRGTLQVLAVIRTRLVELEKQLSHETGSLGLSEQKVAPQNFTAGLKRLAQAGAHLRPQHGPVLPTLLILLFDEVNQQQDRRAEQIVPTKIENALADERDLASSRKGRKHIRSSPPSCCYDEDLEPSDYEIDGGEDEDLTRFQMSILPR
eukprot:SM000001S04759  [mRNA]  locus=s1:2041850:2046387:- [translate_table: standard]